MAYVYSSANLTAGLAPTTNIRYMLRAEHSITTSGSAFDLTLPDFFNIRIDGDITAGAHAFTDSGSSEIFDSARIHILPTSTIQTHATAILLGSYQTLPFSGGSVRLINEGTITSDAGGVLIAGRNMTIVNRGDISSIDDSALRLFGHYRDQHIFVVTNTGTLTTTSTGPNRSEPTVNLTASYLTGRVWFANEGLIESDEGHAVSVSAAYARLLNSGTIDGSIEARDGHTFRLVNSGSIGVDDNGVSLYLTADDIWINNSGIVEGDVNTLGTTYSVGPTTIINTGIFFGDVVLSSESDLYRGIGTGAVVGIVYGGAGWDKMYGGDLSDRFDGGADGDTMHGGGGDDVLVGSHGFDNIIGGTGNDTLDGGFDADTLMGDSGDDLLLGGPA